MFPDEGAEDFNDRGVVSGGVDGDALQGVDAPEADIEPGRAELLDPDQACV